MTILLAAPFTSACDRAESNGSAATARTAPAPASESQPAPLAGAAPHAKQGLETVALHYEVEGMHCGGCVNAITTEVAEVPGVVSCKVKLQEKTADIEVRRAEDEAAVKAAIEKLGYKIKPRVAEAAPTGA